jgi:hypothetical protein
MISHKENPINWDAIPNHTKGISTITYEESQLPQNYDI